MPKITRIYIKTSLIYLLGTLILGLLLALRGMSLLPAFIGYMTPVYYHLLMLGWMTQLIFGIVYWMFPKYSKELPRGRESVAWAVYASLNLGLILRVIAEPMTSLSPNSGWGIMLLLSALAMWLAGVLFVANTWPRVKSVEMPKLSTLFIRTAMLYLITGFTIGALMLINKGLPFYPPLWRLRPLHIEYLLLGWTVQLIMGMAFWILPRWQDRRGDERTAWAAFALLNAGILLATAAALFPPVGSTLLLAGRTAEVVSVAAFAIHAWPRVKPLGA